MKPFWRAILGATGVLLAIGGLVWKCEYDPKINFLPGDRRAEWILFPAALDSRTHPVIALDTIFRRAFELPTEPKSARLFVRAAKRFEIRINGQLVKLEGRPNWKQVSVADVAQYLRAGANNLEARIFNDDAPPALWLRLEADQFRLRSDQTWDSSLAGSSWRHAALAWVPRRAGPGNLVAGEETIATALTRIWTPWITMILIAIVLGFGFHAFAHSRRDYSEKELAKLSCRVAVGSLTIFALLWLVLLWNNVRMLPFHAGFDSRDHVEYIKYIQNKHALPLPNEGFEAFQPPLYYIIATAALWLCRVNAADETAVIVLRVLSMLFGIANFALVFFSLRSLFPHRPAGQFAGLLLAVFLPMHLYLSQYATNELLAATLVTAAVYLTLRALRDPNVSTSRYVIIGTFAGAAMLTKATSILLLPWLFMALVLNFAQKGTSVFVASRAIMVTLVGWFAVCGWHYVRVWKHFGNPLIGNWDPAVGFSWWQDPGFHTAGDYFRFGQSLIAPLFSGFNGFADGIYSTLWGDGLCGGLSDILSRTPWNYDLMIGGYLLAIVPSILILVGIVTATFDLIRQPSSERVLLLGLPATIACAVIFMTLKVASYAQIKAFYGLSALVPVCWFGALGWQKLTCNRAILTIVTCTLLFFWSLNSFCSFWIRSSASQQIYNAGKFYAESKNDHAMTAAQRAVEIAPLNSDAHCFLARALTAAGRFEDALQESEQGVALDPLSGNCHVQLAINFGAREQFERAALESRRGLELEPENRRAYEVAFGSARQLQRMDEAIAIGRNALALSPFDSDLHYRVGLATAETGDFSNAIVQFGYALLLQPGRSEVAQKLQLAFSFAVKSSNAREQLAAIAAAAPDSPDLRNQLAWIFATNPDPTIRNGNEAIRQSERACDLTNRSRPQFLITLAAADAEAGKFSEAITIAQDAAHLAKVNSDEETVNLANNLISMFQQNQPYREESSR